MMIRQQREFLQRGLAVVFKLMKLHGHLVWLLEKASLEQPIHPVDVDAFYERLYACHDAIEHLKASSTWRSVDVEDDVPLDE